MEDRHYTKKNVGYRRIEVEGRHPLTVRTYVDNLGMINLELGNNFTLKMSVGETQKLHDIISDSFQVMKDEGWPPKGGAVEIYEDKIKQIHNARQSAVSVPSGNSKGKTTIREEGDAGEEYVDPFGLYPNDPVKW